MVTNYNEPYIFGLSYFFFSFHLTFTFTFIFISDQLLAHILPRLSLDNEKRVREAVFVVLQCIIDINKQSLTPVMKHIIGYWFMAMGDPCAEVQASAIRCFESAVPPKKREPVLLMLAQNIIGLMKSHLEQVLTYRIFLEHFNC